HRQHTHDRRVRVGVRQADPEVVLQPHDHVRVGGGGVAGGRDRGAGPRGSSVRARRRVLARRRSAQRTLRDARLPDRARVRGQLGRVGGHLPPQTLRRAGADRLTVRTTVRRPVRQRSRMRSVNESGSIGGRRRGFCAVDSAGGGPNFADTVNTRWFCWSISIVRAPRIVVSVSTTLNLSGESSWITVSVPSPVEANASPVPASYRVASTPAPIGSVVISFPSVAFEIAMTLVRHPLNRMWCARSIASPVAPLQEPSGHFRVTLSVFASISATSPSSSRFTETLPAPSDTPNSGPAPKSIVPTFLPDRPSITDDDFESPLNVKMFPVAASNRIASASGAAVVLPNTRSELRSNMITELSPPDVAKPWPVL